MSELYIVIGAQKAGTTWLYETLRNLDNSNIFVPIIKELNFFNQYYELDTNAYINRAKQVDEWIKFHSINLKSEEINNKSKIYQQREVNSDWYKSLFLENNIINVDISPDYSILSEDTINKINKEFIIDGVILIMRRPSDRAISHIRMDCTNWGTKFNELIESEDVYNRSDYEKIIHKWEPIFKDKFYLLDYKLLENEPVRFINSIFSIISVNYDIPTEELTRRVHDSENYIKLTDYQINQVRTKYHLLDLKYDSICNSLL